MDRLNNITTAEAPKSANIGLTSEEKAKFKTDKGPFTIEGNEGYISYAFSNSPWDSVARICVCRCPLYSQFSPLSL